MPRRGSAQFLLLFFRPRRMRKGLALAGLLSLSLLAALALALPVLDRGKGALTGMIAADALQRAAAQSAEAEAAGWFEVFAHPEAPLKRLGLSAVALDEIASETGLRLEPVLFTRRDGSDQPKVATVHGREGPALEDLAIGDRITVAAPSGESLIYEVIARRIVDADEVQHVPDVLGPTLSLITRWPPDSVIEGRLRLVIEAVLSAEPARTPQQSDEQKL